MLEPQVGTFKEIAKYIWKRVMVASNVQLTSYFPSDEKLRRIFCTYLNRNVLDDPQINRLDTKDFQRFVICCILINQAKKQGISYRGQTDIWKYLQSIFVQSENQPQQHQSTETEVTNISFNKIEKKGKEECETQRKYIIHQSNLINLIIQLISRNNKQKQNSIQNKQIYDFVELQSDQTSIVVFKNDIKKQQISKR